MSQHEHGTRLSTGSKSSDSKSKLLTPAKSTKTKLSIEDLNAKIDHQNFLIQQLLDEAKSTKETIAALRYETDEYKKTIDSLIANNNLPGDLRDFSDAIDGLKVRVHDLEGESFATRMIRKS